LNIVLDWIIQPVGLIGFMLILTLISWFFASAKPRLPFLCFCLSTLLFFTLGMPSFANALVSRLENTRQNPPVCAQLQNLPLVVLGGGIDLYVPSNSPYEVLNTDSLIRTLRAPEFADVNTRYYLLGGGKGKRTLSDAMKNVLIHRGVNANNITIEEYSQSTHENAEALLTILPPSDTPSIKLLTSSLHVNRASAIFEKNGYTVCHIGVDTLYSVPKPPVSYLPYLSGFSKSTLALREWMALQVYQIKGYL